MALSRAKTLDIRVPQENACTGGYNQGTVNPERAAKTDSGNIQERRKRSLRGRTRNGKEREKKGKAIGERGKGPLLSRSHPSPAPRDRPGILEI